MMILPGFASGYLLREPGGSAFRSCPDFTTSFGQLSSLDYLSAPALQTFAGITVYEASQVQCDFDFDASGNRARQLKQRIAADDSRQLEETLYLGSYERELHMTKASGSAPPVVTKTVHRHSLGGFAVYTKTEGSTGSVVKLSTILKDHLGSTDLILTGQWNGSTFAPPDTERQSFDPWGERRDADTFVTYRATDSDPFRTSAHDYDRGYTGHEQLDDSGLIHMNGRIYDPELGRMLSPDPVVQVPEYSQNFNRYSYVMNNPLNMTDPTGFSWISKVFHKVGSWLSQNWRTVVSIVVAAVLVLTPGGQAFVGAIAGTLFPGAIAAGGGWALAASGAVVGGITGGLGSALNGGSLGDVLRGTLIGGLQGAIAGGILHGMEANAASWMDKAVHIAGHGVLGGASNAAMGGKFQDGFLSAAASAYAGWTVMKNTMISKTIGSTGPGQTIMAGAIGGTASALGGGKFANGAYTAAFQHLLNAEIELRVARGRAYAFELNSEFAPGGDPRATLEGRYWGPPGDNNDECASGAQFWCGKKVNGSRYDAPLTDDWKAGVSVFSQEFWDLRTEAAANGGTGYLMIAKGWDQNGRYINKNANAGAGNHTVIFLGSDRVNPRDSAWILEQSQFYKARVRSIAWSSLSDYRLVTSHRSYDSRFSVPGRNGF